jgi:hypothetical protein
MIDDFLFFVLLARHSLSSLQIGRKGLGLCHNADVEKKKLFRLPRNDLRSAVRAVRAALERAVIFVR